MCIKSFEGWCTLSHPRRCAIAYHNLFFLCVCVQCIAEHNMEWGKIIPHIGECDVVDSEWCGCCGLRVQ